MHPKRNSQRPVTLQMIHVAPGLRRLMSSLLCGMFCVLIRCICLLGQRNREVSKDVLNQFAANLVLTSPGPADLPPNVRCCCCCLRTEPCGMNANGANDEWQTCLRGST